LYQVPSGQTLRKFVDVNDSGFSYLLDSIWVGPAYLVWIHARNYAQPRILGIFAV